MRMLGRIVLLIVAFSTFFVGSDYVAPQLSIRAFEPRGVAVSIPHTPGVHSFTFHANINRNISLYEYGEIFGETSKKEKGKWTIRNSTVTLKPRDKVYYWMYVNDRSLGYRSEGIYEIRDEDRESSTTPTPTPCVQPTATLCERVVLNLTQILLDLQQEVTTLQDTNGILKELIQKDSSLSKTLFLDGLTVSDNELKLMVQAVIEEKLFLEIGVDNVVRESNGKIKFQVDSVDQKLEIIKAARTKLKHSRFVITY